VVTVTARAQGILEETALARELAARDLVAPLAGTDRAELIRLLRVVLSSSQS
jgi:hypothetical protein